MVIPWIVLFAPAAACLGIVLAARRSRALSAGLAIGAIGLSFLGLVRLLFHHLNSPAHSALQLSIPWVDLPGLSLEFGLLINPLSILMSLVVTGVGLMIFIYSVGYMAHESSFPRYFAFLSLFAFSML